MVPLTALWLPMLVSALFVFVASFVIHMVLPYHRGDYRKVQEESAVQDALRRFGIAPGEACTDMTQPCALTADQVPPGEASIIITSWSEGPPPVTDPVVQLPAGLDADATIGGQPAAFRWRSTDDGAVAWWQLSPPGFPDQWIEVHASLGGRELEQRDGLEMVNELLRTVKFEAP